MKRFIFLVFFLVSFASYQLSNAEVLDVDFDSSMGIAERGRYNLMLREDDTSKRMLDFFRELYNENLPSKVIASQAPKIPKIIHHIWIGPHPLPKLYREYAESCKRLNPDWKYILWTNKDIDSLLSNFPEAERLFRIYGEHKVYCGQKDILEYLILYKYGGVFLDADVKCLCNMDEIVHKYKFFSALEPPVRWSKVPVMTVAILGSAPGNDLFLRTLKLANRKYDKIYEQKNSSLIKRLIRYFVKGKSTKLPNVKHITMRALAEEFINDGLKEGTIVFPATYFNPIFPSVGRYEVLDEIKYLLGVHKRKNELFKKQMPETIAVQDFFEGNLMSGSELE